MKNDFKILIADDSELMRLVMNGFISKFCASSSISETSNLHDTFIKLDHDQYNLLLLDINMPMGDSSPEVVRDLLDKHADLKICMFSGNDKKTVENSYLDAGAIGFIQKDGNMLLAIEEILITHFSN